jgi:hypothetical protein
MSTDSKGTYIPDWAWAKPQNGPLVSFLMPTYGRAARQPAVLNEAVYWFTRQDYSHCELIILNHAAGHTLECSVPGVRVVNHWSRISSLGEKMNMLVRLARGEICLPYEDDDISLPWRASQAVGALGGLYDYFAPGLWWYAQEGQDPVADGKGVGHNCSAFRRTPFLDKYPKLTKGHDAHIHNWALANVRVAPKVASPAYVSYFYRWGVSDLHLSGQADMEGAYARQDPGPPGVYRVAPVMGRDYQEIHERLTGTRRPCRRRVPGRG